MIMFEGVSGVRMNLDKTEIFSINMSHDEALHLAQLFRYQLSNFPFKYLDVPLHKKKLSVQD